MFNFIPLSLKSLNTQGSHKRYVLGQEPVKEPAVAMTTVAAVQHSKDEGKVEVEVEVDTKGVALLRTLGLTGGCSVIIGTIIGKAAQILQSYSASCVSDHVHSIRLKCRHCAAGILLFGHIPTINSLVASCAE